jgi:hypothetical protein
MLEVVEVRALWRPGGVRLETESERALRLLFRKHLAWEHPYEEDASTGERKREPTSGLEPQTSPHYE